MTPAGCEFEADMQAAAVKAGWPERADPELVAHAAVCAVCADVLAIAAAMEEGREELSASASLPDSGRVWRLAQRRARLEAVEAANRPITAVQAIAAVCAVAVFWACFPVAEWLQSAAGPDVRWWMEILAKGLADNGTLAVAIAAMLVLIPAAACLAMGRD